VAHGLDPERLVHQGNRSYDAARAPAARWSQLWAAGQGLPAIHDVRPVADIVDALEEEYTAPAARFARLVSSSVRRGRAGAPCGGSGVGGSS
jgi:nitronate monooxygenase